jgi:tyrosyl-tRNA synthetase
MKISKRLLTVGLILTMLFSLAACSTDKEKDGGVEATQTEATDVNTDETAAADLDAAETDAADVDAAEATDVDAAETDAADVDTAEIEATEVVRRTFGDVVMPETLEEIPIAFEEVSQNFTPEITEEQKATAQELFTLAVISELANDNESATMAWESFDALNLFQ